MSAIWGIFQFDENSDKLKGMADIIRAEYDKLKFDKNKECQKDNFIMACQTDYITKESENEILPIYDEENNIMFVADVLLDNRQEIMDILSNTMYTVGQEDSDGRLLYNMFRLKGKDCVNDVRGNYVMAIFDLTGKNVTFISDPVSSRCLYYIKKDGLIVFSTLLNPIIKAYKNLKPNKKYNKDFLLLDRAYIYLVPGETPYEEVNIMLPRAITKISHVAERTIRYDYFKFNNHGKYDSPEEYRIKFMELYKKAIKDATRTSGEVGIALSSGLDSSSIGVIASSLLEEEGKKLNTYTFVPAIDGRYSPKYITNESSRVVELTQMYPNMNSTFLSNKGKNLFADMDECIKTLEMPYKSGVFSNHLEMCRKASVAGCKVFLHGSFGNTTVSFGDIENVAYDLYCKRKYVTLFKNLNNYGLHEKISRKKLIVGLFEAFGKFKKRDKNFYENYCPDNPFLSKEILEDYDFKERLKKDRRFAISRGFIDETRYKDFLFSDSLFIYLGVYETKFGLKNNMMIKDPTKDVRIIEFFANVPHELFAHEGMTRWFIRSNFEGLLPESIIGSYDQYAYQNSDWIERIERDRDMLIPKLIDSIENGDINEYIPRDRIIVYLASLSFSKESHRKWLGSMCGVESLNRFYRVLEERDVEEAQF